MPNGRNLYNKHRPDSFESLIGNEKTVKTLKTKLSKKTIPNVFLLHGPFGCGKTTIARIIPKELGISDIDVKEFDNGSFRGIDDVRAAERMSKSKPMASPYKVFIFDEFHAITTDAKTAILKWLEEPPKHVIAIICTTDPGKLGKGILSRCIKLPVSMLSESEISGLLKDIAAKEKQKISPKVISRIAAISDGCPREAINALESIEGLSTEEALDSLENYSENVPMNKLFQLLLSGKGGWEECSALLKNVTEEPETVRRAALGYFSAVLNNCKSVNKFSERVCFLVDAFSDNFYDSGKAGLIRTCYGIMSSK